MIDSDFSLLISELNAEPYICRDGFRFLLRKSGHNGHQNLAFGIEHIDIFFFKENVNFFLA